MVYNILGEDFEQQPNRGAFGEPSAGTGIIQNVMGVQLPKKIQNSPKNFGSDFGTTKTSYSKPYSSIIGVLQSPSEPF